MTALLMVLLGLGSPHNPLAVYLRSMSDDKKALRKDFRAFVDRCGPLPSSVLAVPVTYKFVPEEADTEYLQGFVEGRYDSMNATDDDDDPLVEEERAMARAELVRRGVL